jgi:hypothetical protein
MTVDITTAILPFFPTFAKRVLFVGPGVLELARSIKLRQAADIYAITADAADDDRDSGLDGIVDPDALNSGLPFPAEWFDCIALIGAINDSTPLDETLKKVVPYVQSLGTMIIVSANPNYARGAIPSLAAISVKEAIDSGNRNNYIAYRIDPLIEPLPQGLQIDSGRAISHPDGRDIGSAEEVNHLLTAAFVCCLVPQGYNPIEHAVTLSREGKSDLAYHVLEFVPRSMLANPDVLCAVAQEAQLALLAWPNSDNRPSLLHRLFEAQRLFYTVTAAVPHDHASYACLANFWDQAGDRRMAYSLLSTIQFASPTFEIEQMLRSFETASGNNTPATIEPQVFELGARPVRILFVMPARPHYGLDVLYDGLCEIAGAQSITEFPYKPTLHGGAPREMAHYPCMFDRPGSKKTLHDVCQELLERQYDLILWGDVDASIADDAVRQIIDSAAGTPIVIVDQEDEPTDFRRRTLSRLRLEHATYFKREFLDCHDYGPDAFPLPFAYPDSRIPNDPAWERTTPVFWAGPRVWGLRRLFIEHAERVLNESFTRSYVPADYTQALNNSRIGINLFGLGFDTVRYWELPAHGCMLFSKRPPIRIPNNFVDGHSAVFFDDLAEFDERLREFSTNGDRVKEIAQAGHAHLKKFHTGSVRAKQLLGQIEELPAR